MDRGFRGWRGWGEATTNRTNLTNDAGRISLSDSCDWPDSWSSILIRATREIRGSLFSYRLLQSALFLVSLSSGLGQMDMTRIASRPTRQAREFAAHFHLLGSVDFEDCLLLQRRLAYDALSRGDGRIAVLLCEHPPLVTIGRAGSRAHVRLTSTELAARHLPIRYVGRGGGAVLHGQGQIAVYPVVPLAWHGWSIGRFMASFQSALRGSLLDLKMRPLSPPGSYSLAGRTGVLAAVGVSVKHGVTSQGAFLNVHPDMRDQRRVVTHCGRCMSSILSERPLPVKMTAVRTALVAHLAAALGCEHHHLHTGHPLLADLPQATSCESAA